MGWSRISIRGLIVVIALAGLDLEALGRFARKAVAGHAGFDLVVGFGIILLGLNLVILGLGRALWNRFRGKNGGFSRMTTTSRMVVGLYATLLIGAILSFLFLTQS